MHDENQYPELIGIVLDAESELTLGEICRACSVHAECIVELVAEGVLTPAGQQPVDWRFSGTQLRRVRIALRLQDDLGVNLPGAALALQLLDEIHELRARH